jgi:hypothetical protein
VVYFKRSGTPWVRAEAVRWDQYYLILGVIVVVCTIALLAAGGGTVYYVRVYDNSSSKGERTDRKGEDRRSKRGRLNVHETGMTEHEMLIPHEWARHNEKYQ